MICGVFMELLLFMDEITLNWICFRGLDILVFFLWICSVECMTVIFSPNTKNIDNEMISYLAQV